MIGAWIDRNINGAIVFAGAAIKLALRWITSYWPEPGVEDRARTYLTMTGRGGGNAAGGDIQPPQDVAVEDHPQDQPIGEYIDPTLFAHNPIYARIQDQFTEKYGN